jgi:hypothetical protein
LAGNVSALMKKLSGTSTAAGDESDQIGDMPGAFS